MENEDELQDFADEAHERRIRSILIHEPDWEDAPFTALVLEPGEAASRLCASLPLALKGFTMAA